MHKVKTAVIPAAGLGTRFLPITKAFPKEMLPIIDVPVLQLIIEEAKLSGIERVILILSKDKELVKKHFSRDEEYEKQLLDSGKKDLAKLLNTMCDGIKIEYAYQDEQKGLGHALYCVKDLIKDEPFGVLLGDDLVDSKEHEPALKQLISVYNKVGRTIIGVQKVKHSDTYKYGIIKTNEANDLMKIEAIIEKPKIEDAPSDFASLGRYILTPGIFEALKNTELGVGGELQLTDAFNKLIEQHEDIYAYQFKGKRFDVGDKAGFILATLNYGLKTENIREEILQYIDENIKE